MRAGPGAGFATRCVHGAGEPDAATGAVVPPISLASTYSRSEVDEPGAYVYSRSDNPTRRALEAHLARLEGAAHGVAFASGVAAEDALLRFLGPGDHLLLPEDAYAGTTRLARRIHEPLGLRVTTADLTDLGATEAAMGSDTAMVWVETPSNPTLSISDIVGLARLADERGARLVVDNTFATPALQQPLELGAHAVVHSTTKYIGGHSDVVGGFVATDENVLADHLRFVQSAAGAVPSPFDCYLVQRGARTLHLRVERQCANAEILARGLVEHPGVETVLWPGLGSHPGHGTAAAQMSGFGGMLSFTVGKGAEAAVRLCESTEIFTLAESLGAVESLIEHPASMTHAFLAGTDSAVASNLVRLSVGIEDSADLLADLNRALSLSSGGVE